MAEIYNFNSGKLIAKYRDIVRFDLEIRKPITQVYGESATGKTLLVNFVKNEKKNDKFNVSCEENIVSNIAVFDETFCKKDISSITNSLIIIDRCDLILTDDIVDFIATDTRNHYLLFSRTGLPLEISPNYYGEFVWDKRSNTISIYYKYSEVSWF